MATTAELEYWLAKRFINISYKQHFFIFTHYSIVLSKA